MVSIFAHWSNALIVILSCIVFLFLLKSTNLKDKLWLASVASLLIVALISIGQIVAYNNLVDQLKEKETALENLQTEYTKLKSETDAARSTFTDARGDVWVSRQELDDLRAKVKTEFERTIRDIHVVYADISDEELNRRFNNAVRKARQNLQNNVFQ